jgi:hypothetical protein
VFITWASWKEGTEVVKEAAPAAHVYNRHCKKIDFLVLYFLLNTVTSGEKLYFFIKYFHLNAEDRKA